MVQFEPPAIHSPHVLVWVKSAGSVPVMVIPVTSRVAVLRFVTVTVLGLLAEPMAVLRNVILLGVKLIAVCPLPVTLNDCGLLAPSSVTLILAERLLSAVGE